jgi:FkbM family methyltransferase
MRDVSALYHKVLYYLASIFRLLSGVREWPLVLRLFLGRAVPSTHTITLRKSGLRLRVRGAMDVWSVKETFLDRFYERYGFSIGESWLVIDIGAGIGDFTLFAAAGHAGNKVYAFEPFPQSFALLENNVRLNHLANVACFREAIGGQSGELTLDLSLNEPLQIQSHTPSPKSAATLTVPSLSLAEAFTRLGVQSCSLLKLDCEGAEYDILFNAPPDLLRRIERIVMEYHDEVTPYNHGDLVAFLRRHGFRVETFPNVVHSEIGYLRAANSAGFLAS